MGKNRNQRKRARMERFNEQHAGKHRGVQSGYGSILHTRSAPYLKKESVTLTDVLLVGSNGNLGDDSQIIRMGPNGLQLFNAVGTAKPQSAIWSQYGEMYEYYQTDGFSCKWIPNKFEFQTGATGSNEPVIAGPAFSCLDPEGDFPQTPSAILAYNTSKVAQPYHCLSNRMNNYKSLSLQKQEKTMLKTGDGVIGSEETYNDACGFVTYVINPWRAGSNAQRYIGWMVFTITYTFSGLKRPGASNPSPQDGNVVAPRVLLKSDQITRVEESKDETECSMTISSTPRIRKPEPSLQLSDWEIEELHNRMMKAREEKK